MKRIVFLAMIVAGGMSAQPELSALAGRWRGHCGWGANVKRNREHYRIVRISGPNRIEALEWATATDFIVDPPSRPREVVLFEPKRETFVRESELRFRSKTGVIKFVRQGGKLEMLPGEGDACTGFGGEYTLVKDDAFGAWRPSFPCDRATQPREKAICGSAELSMLDQHIALAYRAAEDRIRDSLKGAARDAVARKLKSEQSAWWANQLSHCQAAECVPRLYSERIVILDGIARSR